MAAAQHRTKSNEIGDVTLSPTEVAFTFYEGRYAAHWRAEFTLARLEAQRHFCDAAGDVETLATFVAGAASRDLRPRRTLHTLLSQTLRDWSQRAVNTDRAKSHRLWSHKSRPQPRGRDTYKLTSPGPFF